MKSNEADFRENQAEAVAVAAGEVTRPNLEDPRVVLELLEADQVVAAKRQTHFGQRRLSSGVRVLLWGLRGYVVVMLVIVLISVLRVAHILR